MIKFILKIGAIFVLYHISNYLSTKTGANPLLTNRLALFGGFCIFIGPYLTGSGYLTRGGYVDTPTPSPVWILAGLIFLIIAAGTLVFA